VGFLDHIFVKDDLRRLGFIHSREKNRNLEVHMQIRVQVDGSSKTPDEESVPTQIYEHTVIQTDKELEFVDQDIYRGFALDLHNQMFSSDPEKRESTWLEKSTI
jgi:hypothetical protein